MAKHSISEAARLVGKARSTLQRDLKSSVLSKEKDGKGNPVIDTAELERVYGKLEHADMSEPVAKLQSVAPVKDSNFNELKIEIERLREQLNSKDTETRLLTAQNNSKDEQIEDLKAQRDKWEQQASKQTTLLLTHEQKRQGLFKKYFRAG